MSELTPEQQAEIQALHAALASEFAESEEKKAAKSAKSDLVDLKKDMLASLERVLKHGTLEQASRVAMWGYGKLLEESKADADPIRALIEGMPTPTPKEADATDTEVDVGTTSPEAEAKAQDIPLDVLASCDEGDEPS